MQKRQSASAMASLLKDLKNITLDFFLLEISSTVRITDLMQIIAAYSKT